MRLSLVALLILTTITRAEVKEEPFGQLPDGRAVKRYTLTSADGVTAKVITYGAILTELHVPDAKGQTADVVLGFDTLDGYLKGHPYFGANVGRCANRIANGKFTLDGKSYPLATNNGAHHLHGGKEGFDKKLWDAQIVPGKNAVTFRYTSPDGEENYPGNLKAQVTYHLDGRKLIIEMKATTDKTTICNLAHHSYFNLAGHDKGTILDHTLQIQAKNYTPTDSTLISTGEIAAVKGTPFDFTEPTKIGARISSIKSDPVGYDLNYVLDHPTGTAAVVMMVKDPQSGRVMQVQTTEPGVQFYTGNFLDGKTVGKRSTAYQQYAAFCLEPQKYPDAINKAGRKDWPSPVLKPGEEYKQVTIYSFPQR